MDENQWDKIREFLIDNWFVIMAVISLMLFLIMLGMSHGAGLYRISELNVMFHDSPEDIQKWYKSEGGIRLGMKGYYNPKNNMIHCLEGDERTCGHELLHSLEYHGNPKYEGKIDGH